jgi:nickel-dependent lactate racemase
MRIDLASGAQHLDVDIPADRLIAVRRREPAAPLADPAAAMREALEHPSGFPALRRALTPDDHIAIAVDESIAALPALLPPLLEHLRSAHIQPEAITLVCPPHSSDQAWIEELPDEFQEIRVEVHQPADRKRIAYLATTRQGRRIYLNRTAVDADQLVLLTRRGYDCITGYAGGEAALFPGLSDEATQHEAHAKLSLEAPGAQPWPLKREAGEVAWLLGVPFLLQVIDDAEGALLHVLGGTLEASAEGEQLLDARWRALVAEPADVVLASVGGSPERQSFDDLARAFLSAARVVKPGGSIIVVSDARPALGASAAHLRQAEEPRAALQAILKEQANDLEAGFAWASAAEKAHLYLLSQLDLEVAEEMFTTPLEHAGQVQKLLQRRCLVLPDAHRTMAVIER